jgi:hypothetical protein
MDILHTAVISWTERTVLYSTGKTFLIIVETHHFWENDAENFLFFCTASIVILAAYQCRVELLSRFSRLLCLLSCFTVKQYPHRFPWHLIPFARFCCCGRDIMRQSPGGNRSPTNLPCPGSPLKGPFLTCLYISLLMTATHDSRPGDF